MGVNICMQRWNMDTFLTPFKGADYTEQFAHRYYIAMLILAVGGQTRLGDIGCAALFQNVVCLDRHQQHAKCPGTLGARKPDLMKTVRIRHVGVFAAAFCRAASQCLKQLSGILKITCPDQSYAFAGIAVSGIGCHGVIGHYATLRRCPAIFRVPDCADGLVLVGPVDGLDSRGRCVRRGGLPNGGSFCCRG